MIKKLILVLFLILNSSIYAKMTMSKKTFDTLSKANELIDKEDYKTSKKMLRDLLKSDSSNDYEKSYILQTLSNIYINQDNYKEVAKAYERIIKLNAFEKENIDKIKFSLSKIYLSLEKYKKSINLSKEILKSKAVKKENIYETLILAYYYNGNYKESVKYSNIYFSMKKQIKESWYKILYSSYVELKDYNNAIKVMKKMTILFSDNEDYWVQLASLYQQVNKMKKALSTLELAYKNEILTKKDNILYFINILLQNDVYKKANVLLTKAVKEGLIKEDKKVFELIVSTHINARDTDLAIEKLNNSPFAKENKYRMILANLYYQKQDFKKSIDILKNVKAKHKTKIAGEKYILKGLCYYELSDKKKSIKTIRKAISNPYHKKRARSILRSLES